MSRTRRIAVREEFMRDRSLYKFSVGHAEKRLRRKLRLEEKLFLRISFSLHKKTQLPQ